MGIIVYAFSNIPVSQMQSVLLLSQQYYYVNVFDLSIQRATFQKFT